DSGGATRPGGLPSVTRPRRRRVSTILCSSWPPTSSREPPGHVNQWSLEPLDTLAECRCERRAMKAAVVPALGEPLEIRDLPVPEPDAGQIVVKIEASGLCHTDIHAARGDWPVKPKIPLIPGHEGVGTVVAVGEGDSP